VSVSPSRASVVHITGWLTWIPCSARAQARSSATVASHSAATRARSAPISGARRGGTWLHCGPGVLPPNRRSRARAFDTQDGLAPERAATSRSGASPVASTRSRRSCP
jgi:hypothetical protein